MEKEKATTPDTSEYEEKNEFKIFFCIFEWAAPTSLVFFA